MGDNPLSIQGAGKAKTGGSSTVIINQKFALDFARASRSDRLKSLGELSAAQKETLAKLLLGNINDPKRSTADKSLLAFQEYSPNGNKIKLAIAAIKTLAEDSPKIVITALGEAFKKPASTEHVKRDYVFVMEYLVQRKPAFKTEALAILTKFTEGKELNPYGAADQAQRLIDNLEGRPESPSD